MTTWHDPPDIEQLSDLSWRRIERGLFAKLDDERARVPGASRPARTWRWRPLLAVGSALACAAIVLVVILAQGDGPDSATGPATPSRIVTADAPTHMTFGRASIEIAPNSALWVHTGEHHSVAVMLESGEVRCAVAPGSEHAPFVVHAGDVRVEVIGTRFSVSRDSHTVTVAMSRGAVSVYHLGDHITVEAGERWTTAGKPSAAGSRSSSASATDATDMDAPADTDVPADTNAPADTRPGEPASSPVGIERDDSEPELRAARRSRPARTAKQRYEAAAQLEATDPAAAIAMYRKLARDGGAWAPNALYAQARLELDRGNTRVARRLLGRYLRRYPRGNNAIDARVLLRRIAE